jgi:tetratricopeptide (TPR) repeat protein
MQVFTHARAGTIVLCALLISSCAETGSQGQKNFETEYSTARNALEQGDFAKANRVYKRLVPDAGGLEPRIRLELSHGYLRAGDFNAAEKEAGGLAKAQTGDGRAAALAVQATAEHELGLQAFAKGDTKTGKTYLEQAEAALTEVLRTNPELDPLGSMAGRKKSIQSRLNGLR